MDAFKSEDWNLTQVIAWVLLRDPSIVQQADDSVWDFGSELRRVLVFRKRNQDLGMVRFKEAEVENPPPNDLRLGLKNEGKKRPYFETYEAAEGEIIQAMQSGEAQASGVPDRCGDRELIEAIQWIDLKILWDKWGGAYLAVPSRNGSTDWHEVKIKREQIMKLWPSTHAATPQDPTSRDKPGKSTGEPLSEQESADSGVRPFDYDSAIAKQAGKWQRKRVLETWRVLFNECSPPPEMGPAELARLTRRKVNETGSGQLPSLDTVQRVLTDNFPRHPMAKA